MTDHVNDTLSAAPKPWTSEAVTRLLGACDGMVGCLVKLKMKIGQYNGPYTGRFPDHHVRKIERRDEITRPMRELAEIIERELRQCQAKYEEVKPGAIRAVAPNVHGIEFDDPAVTRLIQEIDTGRHNAFGITISDGEWDIVKQRLQIALRKSPEKENTATVILWCCHVRGPDDVHAAPDYETALKWADMTNAINWRGWKGKPQRPASYKDCLLKAVPAPWPWSAEAHAEDLPKSIAAFEPRGPLPSGQPK